MRVVVGLGNPGARYAATRHNLGFLVVDAFADAFHPDWSSEASYGYAVVPSEGQEVALIKPTTFMNLSGVAVKEALSRFEATPEDLLVLVDDTQLSLGRIRIRRQGSDGGHNGLLSIIEALGTPAFSRLRLGIGAPPEGEALIDFVLGEFEPHEREAVAEMVGRATDALYVILREGLEKAMNQFNKSESIT
ncbi:MAG: aminoacyl-tRNA hydrolase [Candidatus Latescibacteria bacterium]|nr:aminoacyl-tRNA hydrolase [Candidatus Latescibacterota bacterium]